MAVLKIVTFLGDSKTQLRDFPDGARHDAGQELLRVQFGGDPIDWKPMPSIGKSVREIRVSDRPGDFRIVYVANIGSAIYVLHAFQKKSQKTSRRDIELAKVRFALIVREN
jgi:phage-related protein